MPHFTEALSILRDRATDLSGMGRAFERLMQSALSQEPASWATALREGLAVGRMAGPRRARTQVLILVAAEREGGLCAIPCKFFDPHRRLAWRPNGGELILARQDA